jgi:glycosyltransferase involved in cell wall biosynthesis
MYNLAYFSPLNPIKSGISDYSEDLLPHLRKYFNIDLFIPDNLEISNQTIENQFNVKKYTNFPREGTYQSYDGIIYHMGNNYQAHKEMYEFLIRYPGVVVLHDYSIHHFFAEKTLEQGNVEGYKEEMFYCHGAEGVSKAEDFLNGKIPALWDHDSLNYPMNLRILDHSAGIIVHSEFSKSLIKKQATYVPVTTIPMPCPRIVDISQVESLRLKKRDELGMPQNKLVICSLGFASFTKRIDKILIALSELKKEQALVDFKYYIVGEVAKDYPLEKLVYKLDLIDEVVFTGFVTISEFDSYIAASDLCLNLRYPTHGENSGSLAKIIGFGKPVITTDIGSFGEYPSDIVYKIGYGDNEITELMQKIKYFLEHDNNLETSKKILEYARKKHDMGICAKLYANYIINIIEGRENNLYLGISRNLDWFTKECNKIGLNTLTRQYVSEIITIFNR